MKGRTGKFLVLAGIVCIVIAAAFLYSCGGDGTGGSGSVALFLTDNASMYTSVTATIDRIELINTGSGATCTVLDEPTALEITDLAGVLQLISVNECPAAPYNRARIVFEKGVQLTDQSGTSSFCTFTSYKDDHNHPNVLQCNGNLCTLDVNGAVNVLARRHTGMGLDFDLKEFDVLGFNTGSCTVTMKVSPLHGPHLWNLGLLRGVTGLVTNLSFTTQTFDLARGRHTFPVLYSGVTSTGIDALLQRAQDDRLRTQVLAASIDFETKSVTASAIYVKVEGVISNIDPQAQTFTLTYKGGKTMEVDYTGATVLGTLSDGMWVGVKLEGHDGQRYLAAKVKNWIEGAACDN
jgi:hypothetical protein